MPGERRLTSIKQLVNDMLIHTDTNITNIPLHVQNDPIPLTLNAVSVNVDNVSIQLFAANPTRKFMFIQNTSNSADPVYINFKTPAVIGEGLALKGGDSYLFPENFTYTGVVTAISTNINIKVIVATEGS